MERSTRYVLLAAAVSLVPLLVNPAGTVAAAGSHPEYANNCIFDHMMLWTPDGTCRPQAKSFPSHVVGKARRAIYDSALTFGIPYNVLLAIGRCESGLKTHARNAGHFGLFQFLPQTFKRGVALLRRDTGIVARSYWNPLDSAYVAGYLFATGRAGSWTCERAPTG